VETRVLGAEHPATLTSAFNLASSLGQQGKYAEADWIGREVLGARKRVLGAEHPDTLGVTRRLRATLNPATFLARLKSRRQTRRGRADQLEPRLRAEVLGARKCVLGAEHPDTLASASLSNLAASLANQGKHADAERIQREVLGVCNCKSVCSGPSIRAR
jgi:hypothetical protein